MLRTLSFLSKTARIIGNPSLSKDIYETFSQIYEAKKDYKKSLEYYVLFSQLKDTLLNEKSLKQVAELSTIYETEKKESEKKESGKINLEGSLLLSLEKEKAKQIQKEWKKKSLTDEFRIPLLNIIIKKCTTKALVLQEDLNLLPHIPIPHVKTTQNSN